MELRFSWVEQFGHLVPASRASNGIGYSPLSCLLTDDGGIPYVQTVPWFDQCLSRIGLLKNKQLESYDWGREHWAAELSRTEVRVICQLDETCFEIVGIDAFETILLAWRNFIQSGPSEPVPTELHEY
jgi:hypothetical protein